MPRLISEKRPKIVSISAKHVIYALWEVRVAQSLGIGSAKNIFSRGAENNKTKRKNPQADK